jgi:hypothetical protein
MADTARNLAGSTGNLVKQMASDVGTGVWSTGGEILRNTAVEGTRAGVEVMGQMAKNVARSSHGQNMSVELFNSMMGGDEATSDDDAENVNAHYVLSNRAMPHTVPAGVYSVLKPANTTGIREPDPDRHVEVHSVSSTPEHVENDTKVTQATGRFSGRASTPHPNAKY